MTSPELERLANLGHLKREPPARAELEGLIRSGSLRLTDARNEDLSPESRFVLAYNAAHALALAALRAKGYRSDKRYFVFQALPHTLGTPTATSRSATNRETGPNTRGLRRSTRLCSGGFSTRRPPFSKAFKPCRFLPSRSSARPRRRANRRPPHPI